MIFPFGSAPEETCWGESAAFDSVDRPAYVGDVHDQWPWAALSEVTGVSMHQMLSIINS